VNHLPPSSKLSRSLKAIYSSSPTTGTSPSLFARKYGLCVEASGHDWVEGQGSGPRIDEAAVEEEDQYDAMGNKIDLKKTKKTSASDARKVSGGLILDSHDLRILIFFVLYD
jgi:hypothetical protein